MNVGIIIYRSGKKWHELWSALQRPRKIVCVYVYILYTYMRMRDVHCIYIERNEKKKLWRKKNLLKYII